MRSHTPRLLLLLLLLLSLSAVAGCGYKGGLYLPEEPSQQPERKDDQPKLDLQ